MLNFLIKFVKNIPNSFRVCNEARRICNWNSSKEYDFYQSIIANPIMNMEHYHSNLLNLLCFSHLYFQNKTFRHKKLVPLVKSIYCIRYKYKLDKELWNIDPHYYYECLKKEVQLFEYENKIIALSDEFNSNKPKQIPQWSSWRLQEVL